MERDIHFFLVFHIKNHQFQSKLYIYTVEKRFNGMPRTWPMPRHAKPGSAHTCGAMA